METQNTSKFLPNKRIIQSYIHSLQHTLLPQFQRVFGKKKHVKTSSSKNRKLSFHCRHRPYQHSSRPQIKPTGFRMLGYTL